MSPLSCLAALAAVAAVRAHGRVVAPPSRASAWRLGFPTPPDYDDDGVNCGGFSHQWSVNGGKCGVCGDPYDWPAPRPHELGGLYGDGTVTARYRRGAALTAAVDLTTSHRGYWRFNLCPDVEDSSQECFDRHLLELEGGGTEYYPTRGSVRYTVRYRLPPEVVCERCVLQWRYTAGNNWGVCPNGTQGLGCGHQEQFGACSDISIGDEEGDETYPLLYYLKHGLLDLEGLSHVYRPRPPKPRDPRPPKASDPRPTNKPHDSRPPRPRDSRPPRPRDPRPPKPHRRRRRSKRRSKRNRRNKKRHLWK